MLKMDRILKAVGFDIDAFRQLTRRYMSKEMLSIRNMDGFYLESFNETVPDHPSVEYYSFAGGATPVSMLSPLRIFYSIILKQEGENDGLVSTQSSKWGTFLGTLKEVRSLLSVGY